MTSEKMGRRVGAALAVVVGTSALFGVPSPVGAAIPDAGLPAEPVTASSPVVSERTEILQAGVWGRDETNDTFPNTDVSVLAFAEHDGIIYVGGKFTEVVFADGRADVNQPYLAAFDRETGAWISSFRPTLDGNVWDLKVTDDGDLIIAGQFTTVNGASNTAALARIDLATGQVDPNWRVGVVLTGSNDRALVRAVDIDGDDLYLGGNFTRVTGPNGDQKQAGRIARVSLTTGNVDGAFLPNIDGIVFDIDADGDRVYAAGNFFYTNGVWTIGLSITQSANGQVVPGLEPWVRTYTANNFNSYQQAVMVLGDDVWQVGAQHNHQAYRRSDHALLRSFVSDPWGDGQALANNNGIVYGGSHANGDTFMYTDATTRPVGSYSSRLPTRWMGAWDNATKTYLDWYPQIGTAYGEGAWELFIDSTDCLWAGGDFNRGSYDGNTPRFVQGFAKFCATDTTPPAPPTNPTASVRGNGGVNLAWDASTGDDRGGDVYYELLKNDDVLATFISITSFPDPAGTPDDRYFVRAVDATGNRSATTAVFRAPDVDTDGDGIVDRLDPDDDNDGVPDEQDAFPRNPNETTDTDGDGVGDNGDAFPNDPNESVDSDGDGIGDNADLDVDNDGIPGAAEVGSVPFSVQTPSFTIAPDGGSTSVTVDLSSTGVAIGQTVTVSGIVADGDLNGGSETFSLNFNAGEAVTPQVQTGGQCVGSLGALTSPFTAQVAVADIGGGTPGLNVTGATTVEVDALADCGNVAVEYRFDVSGEGGRGGDVSVQSPSFTIAPDGGSTSVTLDLSATGVAIGQTATVSNVVADGDLNSGSETFSLNFNAGEAVTPQVQTGGQCVGSLGALTSPFSAPVTVVDIGGGTPGLNVTGATTVEVDALADCGGVAVEYRFEVAAAVAARDDADEDGVPNRFDLDSDNDAIPDVVEAGLGDADSDFRVDDPGLQGTVDPAPDTDGDGTPDFLDIDSDGDGTFDIAGTPFAALDTNGDGVLDGGDVGGGIDSNGNGVDDLVEPDTQNPSTPQNLAAVVEANGDVTLTWDAATDNVGVTEYQVLRNGAEIGVTAVPGFTVPVPAPGSHWYQVRARDAAGNEGFKTPSVRVDIEAPDTQNPGTPQNLAAVVEANGDVTLTWDAATDNVGVTEYQVLRNGAEIGVTAVPGFTVPVPAPGSHWYQVRARDAAGNEGFKTPSVRVDIEAPDTQNPGTPQNLAAVVEANGDVTLTWDAATDNVGVTEYQVLRNGAEIGVTAVPGFTVPAPAVGSHWYQVRARDAAGNEGFKTPSVRVDIAPPDTTRPSTPQNLAAVVEANGDVTLTWDAASDNVGVVEYVVERNAAEIGRSGGATSFVVPAPAPGSHWYQVYALDAAGNQSFDTPSVRVDIAAADTTNPSTPQNLAAVVEADGDVTLTWDAATDNVGVTEYQVLRNGVEIGLTPTPGFVVPAPAVGSHWYQVRARDAAGNESFKTPSVRVDIAPPDTQAPTTPQNLAAVVEVDGDVTLTWDAATDNVGVTEYRVLRNGAEIGVTADLTFVVPTPAVGSHWYQVRARDAAGNEGNKTAPVQVDIV